MGFSMPAGMTVEQMLRVMAPEAAAPDLATPEPAAPAKRARVGGKFKADDPATPAVDEAWESET